MDTGEKRSQRDYTLTFKLSVVDQVECVSQAMESRTKAIKNSAAPAEPSHVQQKPTAPTVASSPHHLSQYRPPRHKPFIQAPHGRPSTRVTRAGL